MKAYRTPTMVRLCGVSYSTLRRWVQSGHLPPPEKRSDGRRGVWLVWTPEHLKRARALARRRRQGLPLEP